jgi:hypothetical protein
MRGYHVDMKKNRPSKRHPILRGMASVLDGMASIGEGMATIMDFGRSTRHRDRMLRRLEKGPEPWFGPPGPDRPWPWP